MTHRLRRAKDDKRYGVSSNMKRSHRLRFPKSYQRSQVVRAHRQARNEDGPSAMSIGYAAPQQGGEELRDEEDGNEVA